MRKALRIVGIGLAVLSLATLAGCDFFMGLFGIPEEVGEITWVQDAVEWRGNNNRIYIVTLPSGGSESDVWGTDVYTDDSSIGSAAVHKGLVDFNGGTVAIKILPSQDSYTGTLRNGITSQSFASWGGSFEFVTDY
jgi:hypothetical protein